MYSHLRRRMLYAITIVGQETDCGAGPSPNYMHTTHKTIKARQQQVVFADGVCPMMCGIFRKH